MTNPNIDEVVAVWKEYVASMSDWQELVKGVEPKQTVCGPIYEPPSPLDRPNETFAVADMREVELAAPHYHKGGETEIYFVVTGTGLSVVGGQEKRLSPGVVSVTPPNTAHFTIPEENLVMVVINTPPFQAENVVELTESNTRVGFDAAQLADLTKPT